MSERHRERVYKRTAEANVTCFGKGGARERADDAFLCHRHKKASEQSGLCSDVVEMRGVEPLSETISP